MTTRPPAPIASTTSEASFQAARTRSPSLAPRDVQGRAQLSQVLPDQIAGRPVVAWLPHAGRPGRARVRLAMAGRCAGPDHPSTARMPVANFRHSVCAG